MRSSDVLLQYLIQTHILVTWSLQNQRYIQNYFCLCFFETYLRLNIWRALCMWHTCVVRCLMHYSFCSNCWEKLKNREALERKGLWRYIFFSPSGKVGFFSKRGLIVIISIFFSFVLGNRLNDSKDERRENPVWQSFVLSWLMLLAKQQTRSCC